MCAIQGDTLTHCSRSQVGQHGHAESKPSPVMSYSGSAIAGQSVGQNVIDDSGTDRAIGFHVNQAGEIQRQHDYQPKDQTSNSDALRVGDPKSY